MDMFPEDKADLLCMAMVLAFFFLFGLAVILFGG
jgi:hypothetical protein